MFFCMAPNLLYRGVVRNFKLWVHFLLICKNCTFLWNCGCKCYAPIGISSETVGAIAPTAPTLTPPLIYTFCTF